MKKFQGKVIHGVSLGAKFGIATANLEVKNIEELSFEYGVYFASICCEGKSYNGILHYGERMTFGDDVSMEVHILDFSQDIYGELIEIEILKFERQTKVFQNADMLYTQIENDVIRARKFFLRQEVFLKWERVEKPGVRNKKSVEELGRKAVEVINQLPHFQKAQNILAYAPTQYEIPFIKSLCEDFSQKQYFFPTIQKGKMQFYPSKFKDLRPGKYRILEPEPKSLCADYSQIEIAFVPAIAVDKDRNRLGRGGGFYDRILEKINAPKIAVIPEFAFVENVWAQEHDQKVDEVVVIR